MRLQKRSRWTVRPTYLTAIEIAAKISGFGGYFYLPRLHPVMCRDCGILERTHLPRPSEETGYDIGRSETVLFSIQRFLLPYGAGGAGPVQHVPDAAHWRGDAEGMG